MDSTHLRRASWLAAGLLLGTGVWIALRLVAERSPVGAARDAAAAPKPAVASEPTAEAQPGFVVWESNRGGAWRLWTRRLKGSAPRQLTPEEGRRSHCCPQISPDGGAIAYLSLEPGPERYPEGPERGALRLVHPDGSGDKVLAPEARTYGEHRAIVWLRPGELVYLDGEGHTVRLDLTTGQGERLTTEPHPTWGWLPSPTLTHVTTGTSSFSPFDAKRKAVAESQAFGGCQPYFSPDGRWGYWVAGTGGPIDKIDLASGTVSELLAKHDRRMPAEQGYLYFPMLSPDGRLLAFAASADQHPHFTADYDVYVVETDPGRLELSGAPVRYTNHPATDRFPAVFLDPLPLGFHAGEVPFSVSLAAPPEGGRDAWSWDLGDGTTRQDAASLDHTYDRPGSYAVVARRDGEALAGRVRVRPAEPPWIEKTTLRGGGREVVVRFDEAVDAGDARLVLTSGGRIEEWRLEEDRTLWILLAEPLATPDALRIHGLRDVAQRQNPMPETDVPLEPGWPADRQGLVFLWETGDAGNRVPGPDGTERSFALEREGEVRLDHAYRMDLGDGRFRVADEAAAAVSAAIQGRNELALEATLTPRRLQQAAVLALSNGRQKGRNLMLAQDGGRLFLTLLAARVENRVDLGPAVPGKAIHLQVSYRPGRLVVHRDGRVILDGPRQVHGDFFHWKPRPLVIGAEAGRDGTWSGLLEGVVLFARFVAPEEARENARRHRLKTEARDPVPRLCLRGRLIATSRIPTLSEISPYREALALYEYRVEEVLSGGAPDGLGDQIRVAHWVILGGDDLPAARWRPGEVRQLELEPFASNPQLEIFVLSDTLEPATWKLFHAVR